LTYSTSVASAQQGFLSVCAFSPFADGAGTRVKALLLLSVLALLWVLVARGAVVAKVVALVLLFAAAHMFVQPTTTLVERLFPYLLVPLFLVALVTRRRAREARPLPRALVYLGLLAGVTGVVSVAVGWYNGNLGILGDELDTLLSILLVPTVAVAYACGPELRRFRRLTKVLLLLLPLLALCNLITLTGGHRVLDFSRWARVDLDSASVLSTEWAWGTLSKTSTVLVLFAACLTFALLTGRRQRGGKRLLLVLMLAVELGAIAAFGRFGYYAAAATALVATWRLSPRGGLRASIGVLSCVGLITVLIASVVISTPNRQRLHDVVTDGWHAKRTSVQVRLGYWRDCLAVGWQHPLLGRGLGKPSSTSYGFDEEAMENPHSVIFWLVSRTGFLGMLVCSAALVALIRVGFRVCREETDPTMKPMAAGLFSYTLALMTLGLVEAYPPRIATIYLWTSWGILLALYKTLPRRRRADRLAQDEPTEGATRAGR